jgi:hypothetical protein
MLVDSFPISKIITKFEHLKRNVLPSTATKFAGISLIPDNIQLFKFSVGVTISKEIPWAQILIAQLYVLYSASFR